MPQGRLTQVLRGLASKVDTRLLVGPSSFDDAGVVVLGDESGLPSGVQLHLVQTVDFFPPVVDDARLYGAIAAANALSDVYAMGGRAISALTLASFPAEFPEDWLGEILEGGFAKVAESGAVVAGGHTVEGELQFGFAVTGLVDPERLTANAGAQPGDRIYLTKSLGMGTLTTAAKKGKIDWSTLEPAAQQMAQLNETAAAAMTAVGATACTDVTGFGLIGHARNVARASGVSVRFECDAVPLFPGALELSRRGLNSGGAKRGRSSLGAEVRLPAQLEEAHANLFFDAETSGGLLVFLPAARADAFEAELERRNLPVHAVGSCQPAGEFSVEFV